MSGRRRRLSVAVGVAIALGLPGRVAAAPSCEAAGASPFEVPRLSQDGSVVVFATTASLVPEDTNGTLDVYARNLEAGGLELVSIRADGSAGDGRASWPSISADGRMVAFQSDATNMTPGDDFRGQTDVFVRDLRAGTTELVSPTQDGASGKGASSRPDISPDGSLAAFQSAAPDLVGNDPNKLPDVFVRDLETGSTARVSVLPGGRNYMLHTCWSFHANWTVTSPDGLIYMPRPYCDNLEVAISRDNGLTWERSVVARYSSAQGTDFGSDARLARDRAGNLYYLWIAKSWYIGDGERPLLSISRDDGRTWSAPIDVGVPGLTAAKFPSIVAGGEGRIAVFYVGSKVPGGFGASEEEMKQATWDAYVGFSLNALDEQPVYATTTANPAGDPLRRGPCDLRCSPEGTECTFVNCSLSSSEIGMYDYLQLALDPTSGRVAASLVDLCAGSCPAASDRSGDWSFIGAVGVQVGGPSVLSSPTVGPSERSSRR